MKKIVKRGHIYSLVFMAMLAGSLIGYSRYRELPSFLSEVLMAIGAMLILFVLVFTVIYLIYFLTSLVFGVIVSIVLRIKYRKKDDDVE